MSSGGAASSWEGLGQSAAADLPSHGQDSDDHVDEGRHPRVLRAPNYVSKEEREAHEATHCPYRSWCEACVKARGRNSPHRRQGDDDAGAVPKISLDYFFLSGVDEAASSNPILVMLDEDTGEKYARAVGVKGLGRDGELDWLVRDLSDELKGWGHCGGSAGHIILKSDSEPSIVLVCDALARYHGGKVVPERPPRGESASNGAIEEAGKSVREFTRVLREALLLHSGIKLEEASTLMQWAIRWAAMLSSRFATGKDGRTPYERRRGRPCRIPAVPFGEQVWYKELRERQGM